MASTQFLLFISVTFIFLLSPSTSLIPTETIQEASKSLFDDGYVSMALTLEFGFKSLPITLLSYMTIFSPRDSAFAQYGQPPLSLLNFHFSPHYFPFGSFKSLPLATKIPTLSPNNSLVVTSSMSSEIGVSLNGVKIYGQGLYDDGYLVVYGVEEFFDPNFKIPSGSIGRGSPNKNLQCSIVAGIGEDHYSFDKASEVLRSNGYSVVASFLDVQLAGFKGQSSNVLTIFAPLDKVIKRFVSNYTNYRKIFLRHVLPCRIPRRVLNSLENGTGLPTHWDNYLINVTRHGEVLLLDGVEVIAPNLYTNSWLVVHGIFGVLGVHEGLQVYGPSSSSEKVLSDFDFVISVACFLFPAFLYLQAKL